MDRSWRNARHRYQPRMTLSVYAAPTRGKRVSGVGTGDIPKVPMPMPAASMARRRSSVHRQLGESFG